ncbi:MAG: hypothetical protein DYG88_04655 [Chloroflexi bacterium CFX4]|nr:hypothetical protein [Chloroflexi bacterium CFX4]MDL1924133.1 hypothetical protein [Chloroflexi bacterium CFX3]
MLQQLLNAFMSLPDSEAMVQFAAQVPAPLLDMLEQVLEAVLPQQPPEVQAALRQRLADLRRVRGSS